MGRSWDMRDYKTGPRTSVRTPTLQATWLTSHHQLHLQLLLQACESGNGKEYTSYAIFARKGLFQTRFGIPLLFLLRSLLLLVQFPRTSASMLQILLVADFVGCCQGAWGANSI